MLTLADGIFFPLVAGVIPWGRASGPAGLAPEALQERVFLQGFFTRSVGVRGVSFSRHRRYYSRPRRSYAHASGIICVRCTPGGVVVRRAPEPGLIQGDQDGLSDLLFTPSPSLRGTEGEVSATRIEWVANCGFLFELLSGDSSGRPCPVR
jgi:hypothetical protein